MSSEESGSLQAPQPPLHSGSSLGRVGLLIVNAARSFWAMLVTRRPIRIAVGVFLLLLGIAGLFLPVLQGVATIIAALAILRKDIPLAERIWQRWIIPLEQRYQRWRQNRQQRRDQSG